MDRLRGMFGGQSESSSLNPDLGSNGISGGNNNDDESSSLINDSTSSSNGVFSKGAELLDQMETGPDYKIAGGFLLFSVLFFFAAFTSLPFILVSPRSFNLYFCFGSIFLQLALAFYYAPLVYLRKLFSSEGRLISAVYMLSLLLDLYFIWAGAGYVISLVLVGLQGVALTFLVMQAIGGADRANGLAYTLLLGSIISKFKGLAGGKGGESSLPI